MSRNSKWRILPVLAVPLLAGACYNLATPSFHPGDARQVMSAITRRGVDVQTATAGDSACQDASLVPNAMHLRVTDPSGGAQRDVWIYTFREKYWSSSQAPVDACQADYQAANPGVAITRIDIPTYRVFGADWSTALAEAVRNGLAEASQQGDP